MAIDEKNRRATVAFIFPNGNIAVTDQYGQQISDIQGSVYFLNYLRRLARRLIHDGTEINGSHPVLEEYLQIYRERPVPWGDDDEDEQYEVERVLRDKRYEALVGAGDNAVQILRFMFAPPPNTQNPTLGQLEDAIRAWERALGPLWSRW